MPNGTFRAKKIARGFEQEDGVRYDEEDKAAPGVNEITIHNIANGVDHNDHPCFHLVGL